MDRTRKVLLWVSCLIAVPATGIAHGQQPAASTAKPAGPAGLPPLFLESEFAVASIRWLTLDISRVVTRGQTWVEKPDLSKVDEIGFADLLPGSGHGWGGFVNVARIEVYGRSIKR